MRNLFDKTLFIASLMMAFPGWMAQAAEPETGIFNRTNYGGFWRYDFNYETVDADGETPVILSAAIFMTPDLHDKTEVAKGCGILNHYTITDDKQRPTNVGFGLTLESVLVNANYFLIESDGFGFGIDKEHNQKYLQGRATARVDIDAFIAGKKLLEEEGFDLGNATLNLGYSQGGHSGMWVNRLVAEGYRSEELPKIDYCIIGGGPYDLYAHYQKLAAENLSQYPVALPLIFSGMIDAGGGKVKNEDVFTDDFVEYLPELFDSKEHDTDYINHFIYERYGNAGDKRLPIDKLLKPAFFDEESVPMTEIIHHLKQNSLVYDSWKPEKTDHISFVHSKNDEVVPFLNMENMKRYLLDQGYEAFDIDDTSEESHTDTGIYYVLKAITDLTAFIPTGTDHLLPEQEEERTHGIYSINGTLISKDATLSDAYHTLPRGIYIIDGQKIVKP